MRGFRHLVPNWWKLGCEWPRRLEGYLPYHLTVSLHLHRELTPVGLVGLLKRVHNLDSVCSGEAHETAPLFKADNATLSFYATKDGKISVSYQGWDQSKTVLARQTVCAELGAARR